MDRYTTHQFREAHWGAHPRFSEPVLQGDTSGMSIRRPPASTRVEADLLERRDEMDRIERALAVTLGGTGQLIVVEGEAGLGKTALLVAARETPTAARLRQLSAMGSELEQLHPFGVAASLLGPVVRELGGPEALTGPAEPARALFDPRTEPTGFDPLAIIHAAMWLIVDASEQQPLLLTVDDAHWADEPSLRLMAHIAHRLADLPVALLVGTRIADSPAPEVSEQIRAHREAIRLPLRHLSATAVATLVERIDGTQRESADPQRMWSRTGGNPFYVVELVRARASSDGADGPDVPDTIRASIRRRLTACGPHADTVAEAVAVLGADADLATVQRLSRTTEADAVAAIRSMTERAILQPRQLAFTHPIVAATVMESIPDAVAGQMHRQAAQILMDDGQPATAAATHLLATAPSRDTRVAATLRDAARMALAKGDPGAATRYLLRALREPPARADHGLVLLDLAKAAAATGDPGANERFDEAVRHLRHPHERAQARLAQGHALIQSARWTEGARAFEAGLAEVDARDVELKSRLEAGFVSSAYVGLADHAEASRRLERILAAPLHDPAHRELAAWTAFQQVLSLTATASESTALAKRSLRAAPLEQLIPGSQVIELVAGVLIGAGEVVDDIALLDEAIATAQRLNAHQKAGIYHYCRALPHLLSGRIADAIADAETALAIHDLGWEVFYPGACAALAWAHLERGDVDAAAEAVAIDEATWGQRLDYQFMVRIARGRIRSALGDRSGALEQFELARAAGVAMGIRTCTLLADWRSWCTVELMLAGDRRAAIELGEEGLDIARRWGAPLGEARALSALGIARGGHDGLADLEAAVDLLAGGPIHLELTRVLVELGSAQRRAGRLVEARDSLRRGADVAHRIGAVALGARARDELSAAGARPRRYAMTGIDALTPSELRVARLAANGRTNREAAQALFVTPKAVEYHLANAYRKLGIGGRSELPAALREDGLAPTG